MRLVNWQYTELQKQNHMIEPYEGALIKEAPHGPVLPYGQVEDGYVLRLSHTSALVNYLGMVDPKAPPRPKNVTGLKFIPERSRMMVLTVETIDLPHGYRGYLELLPEYAACGLLLVADELRRQTTPQRVMVTLVNPLEVGVYIYPSEGCVKLVVYDDPPLAPREDYSSSGAALELPEGYDVSGSSSS